MHGVTLKTSNHCSSRFEYVFRECHLIEECMSALSDRRDPQTQHKRICLPQINHTTEPFYRLTTWICFYAVSLHSSTFFNGLNRRAPPLTHLSALASCPWVRLLLFCSCLFSSYPISRHRNKGRVTHKPYPENFAFIFGVVMNLCLNFMFKVKAERDGLCQKGFMCNFISTH